MESKALILTLVFLGLLAAAVEGVDAYRHRHQKFYQGAVMDFPQSEPCASTPFSMPEASQFYLLSDHRTGQCVLTIDGLSADVVFPEPWSLEGSRQTCPALGQYWRPSTKTWCNALEPKTLAGGCVDDICLFNDRTHHRWFATWNAAVN